MWNSYSGIQRVESAMSFIPEATALLVMLIVPAPEAGGAEAAGQGAMHQEQLPEPVRKLHGIRS